MGDNKMAGTVLVVEETAVAKWQYQPFMLPLQQSL
jgi:hypothetical protein